MKKTTTIFLTLALVISLFFNLFTALKPQLVSNFGFNMMYKHTIINNEEQALEYAKFIIRMVCGEDYDIKGDEPYKVSYDTFFKVWRVEGSLPEGFLGGVPVVVFDKNGCVLRFMIGA